MQVEGGDLSLLLGTSEITSAAQGSVPGLLVQDRHGRGASPAQGHKDD